MTFLLIMVIFLVLTSLLLSILLLFPSISSLLHTSPETIGYSQLIIEIANLAALIFAAWEFIKSRQKPDVKVWLHPVEGTTDIGEPSKLSGTSWVYSGISNRKGILYGFKFRVLLGNEGNAAAKYVKITMSLGDRSGEEVGSYTGLHFQRLSEDPAAGHWVPRFRNQDKPMHVFHGGDDFIAYSHKGSIPNNKDLLDTLGTFEVHVPAAIGDTGEIVQEINLNLYADGMEMKKETFYLEVTRIEHHQKLVP